MEEKDKIKKEKSMEGILDELLKDKFEERNKLLEKIEKAISADDVKLQKKVKAHFLDVRKKMAKAPETTIIKAILDSKGKGDLIVQFYYGTLIKELDGSQVFFSYIDSHDPTSDVNEYKKAIAAKIDGIEEKDIKILDAKTKEQVTEG